MDGFTAWLDQYGLAALFAFTFLQELGLPLVIPNELVLGFFGAAVARGAQFFPFVFLTAVVGDMLGTLGLFLVARKVSRAVIERLGGKVGIRYEKISQLEKHLRRWEMLGIAVGRTIPFVRIYISLAAAVLGMPFWRFFLPALIGAVVWAGFFLTVGFLLGERWDELGRLLPPDIGRILIALLAIKILIFLGVRKMRRRKQRGTDML